MGKETFFQSLNINLAKLTYFTTLDLPENRGYPFLSYLLGFLVVWGCYNLTHLGRLWTSLVMSISVWDGLVKQNYRHSKTINEIKTKSDLLFSNPMIQTPSNISNLFRPLQAKIDIHCLEGQMPISCKPLQCLVGFLTRWFPMQFSNLPSIRSLRCPEVS